VSARLDISRALALALAVTACKGGEPAPTGRAGRGNLTFSVDVMPVEAKKASYLVTAPGTIDAFERVQVTARVAGAVDRVAFSEGQQVKKGDTLVAIAPERFGLAVASAKAALDKAEVTLKDADAMIARREGAAGQSPGLIPGEEIASLRAKSAGARADREVARAALQVAQVNLRDAVVRAPMEGIIQTRTVETGQYVQAGYVMATLLRSEPMLLRFQVEPRDAPRLKLGMTASFTMRETQRKFSARLTLIAGSADLVTHMVAVTAELVDEGHKYWLRPGSFCDVTIELDAEREAPLIPRTGARATDHGYVSYVIDGEVAKERVLTLGMSTKDGWIEVRSGIAAGDLLVVHGAEALTNGAKVRVTRVTAESLLKGELPDAGAPVWAGPGAASGEPRHRRAGGPPGAASAGGTP
jgi:RND family efflux transporter MFP subunit